MCSFHPRRNALRAYIHHGPGFGSGGGTGAAEKCDIYFGLSESERLYLEGQHPQLFDGKKAYFAVGFPKSDAFVNGAFSRDAVLQQHGLEDRRTLLIASKQNPSSLLRTLEEKPFRILAAEFPDWNIIQTGHPWLWENRDDIDRAWQQTLVSKLDAIANHYPNAYFLPNVPAEPLAAVSDVLVADGTSVLTMFSLLDRPIVHFDNLDRTDTARKSSAHYRNAAYTFNELDQIAESCRTAMEDRNIEIREGRRFLKEHFFANCGRASDKMADILIGIGRICSTESAHWPNVLGLSRVHPD